MAPLRGGGGRGFRRHPGRRPASHDLAADLGASVSWPSVRVVSIGAPSRAAAARPSGGLPGPAAPRWCALTQAHIQLDAEGPDDFPYLRSADQVQGGMARREAQVPYLSASLRVWTTTHLERDWVVRAAV